MTYSVWNQFKNIFSFVFPGKKEDGEKDTNPPINNEEMPPPQGIPQRSPYTYHSPYENAISPYSLNNPTTQPSKYDVVSKIDRHSPLKETPGNKKPIDLPQIGSMPAKQAGFNRVLDGLKKRQLQHDFQLEKASETYQPTQNIGSGAFGIVCEAMETSSNEKVAIKKVAHASATPTLARRTLREIRVLRYINHPNIVALRDIFRTKGPLGIDVYLVMDLMSNNLHQIIYGMDPLEEYYVISFLHQLLKGLDYLHAAHIAHRDLKPSNLLVNGDGTLRIADFGMAKCTDMKTGKQDDADDHCFYMTQHVATLPYRAPELLFVMPEHSTAVDMWAVGCIFGEMVMREELFPGRSVPTQIKILLQCFGKPEQHIIDDIRCDRTKKLIEDFGTENKISYDDLLFCKQREIQLVRGRCEVVDFVSRLFAIDASERLTVTEALKHRYISSNTNDEGEQPKCPFKVKMDMIGVESLGHEQLVQMLCTDVRSADKDHTYREIHSGESTDTDNSTETSSSGGFPSPPDSTQDVSTQISLCEPDSYV